MRIIINATLARQGGQATWLRNALRALVRVAPANEYLVAICARRGAPFLTSIPDACQVHSAQLPTESWPARFAWEQIALPAIARRWHADVIFCMGDLVPLKSRVPTVCTLRNWLPYARLKSGPVRSLRWWGLRRLAEVSVRAAHSVVFVSRSSAQGIGDVMGIPREKRAVVYNGVSDTFQTESGDADAVLKKFGLVPRRYVFYASVLYEHENVETLIRAFAGCRGKDVCDNLQLVLVGSGLGSHYHRHLVALAGELGVGGAVRFLGSVMHELLPPLYRNALAFVSSSLIETFGIPVLEAMACGVPVIASDIPAYREIGCPSVRYFAAKDDRMLAVHLQWASSLPVAERSALAHRFALHARGYSWDQTARQLIDVLERVVADG